jgi:hypothetical protein
MRGRERVTQRGKGREGEGEREREGVCLMICMISHPFPLKREGGREGV